MARYSQNDSYRILSRPCPIYWAGWKTTTYELQANKWRLAVDYDVMRMQYVLIMNHKTLGLWAVTDSQPMREHQDYVPEFSVVKCSAEMYYREIVELSSVNFMEFDATPTMTHDPIKNMEDLNIFNTIGNGVKEVYIETQADMSVVEHLEEIARKQKPVQADIRDRDRKREARENRSELIMSVVKTA